MSQRKDLSDITFPIPGSMVAPGQSAAAAPGPLASPQPTAPATPATPAAPEAAAPTPEPEGPAAEQPPSRKRKLRRPLLIAAAVLLLGGTSAAAGWYFSRPAPPPPPPPPPAPAAAPEPPKPTTKASILTGAELPIALADRPITGVMVENSPDARPQSGLSNAGVVYEALAEGGVTRFLALYQEQRPSKIGPVRSLRPYYIDWVLEHGAPIAHAGGSHDAIMSIAPLGVKSMNALNIGAPFYRARDRYAPHNLYITADGLDSLLARNGWNKPNTTAPWPRKPDEPKNPAPHPQIRISYSYPAYAVEYRYDPATNDYVRYMAGAPHIERETGKPIRVKNVIVEYVPLSNRQAGGYTYADFPTVGSGVAIVFRDGTAVKGSWSKESKPARTIFRDAQGQEIRLNVGHTWIGIVPNDKPVIY